MNWTRLRATAKSLLIESLRKRIDFHITSYATRRHSWASRAWVTIDGGELLNMAALYGCTCEECSVGSDAESIHSDGELTDALEAWTSISADQALSHDSALVRAFALVDRRVGKRRLKAVDMTHAPPLASYLYLLRCAAEGVAPVADLAGKDEALAAQLRMRHVVSKKRRGSVEHRVAVRAAADNRLAEAGKDNPRRLIERLREDSLGEPCSELGRRLEQAYQNAGTDAVALLRLLSHVERHSQLLRQTGSAMATARLAIGSDAWMRQPEAWKPTSRNATRQFASLARWLWASYEVPELFDQAWHNDDPDAHGWFRHLGAGRSLRTAPALPCPLTKRESLHILQAPRDLSIRAAIRWGQTVAIGGDARLAKAVAATRMQAEFQDDRFWLSVIRFLVRNPMLDSVHVGPIIDYVWSQRFEPRRAFGADGQLVELSPAQPNLSMAQRQVGPLLVEVRRWHRDLGRLYSRVKLQWPPSGIAPFCFTEGGGAAQVTWECRELLFTDALIAESQRMQHCVASYDGTCARGKASIWTLERREGDALSEPRLTIEISLPQRCVAQVRGRHNRLPDQEEWRVISRWAEQAGLEAPSQ